MLSCAVFVPFRRAPRAEAQYVRLQTRGVRPCAKAQCVRLQTREGCVPAPKPCMSGCRHGGCVPAPEPSVPGCRHEVRPCAKAQCVRLQTRGGTSLRQSPVCPVADTGGVRPCVRAQCVRLQTRSRLEFVVAVHRDSKYESQVPTTHYSLHQTHRAWRGRKPPLPILPATDTQGLARPQTYHA